MASKIILCKTSSSTWCCRRLLYKTFGVKFYSRASNDCNLYFLRQKTSFDRNNYLQKLKITGFSAHRRKLSSTTSSNLNQDVANKSDDKEQNNFPAAYDPKYVESRWYDWWVRQGFFQPEHQQKTGKKNAGKVEEIFSMVLPPPNVTGSLHLGHALTNSVQDALIRWHRMSGKKVVWVPGCDHAGIATQVVVEKKLWKEKKLTRHDIGRDKFLDEVWNWKNEKGGVIVDQMKKLGSSLDWSRECFTMDQKLTKAVVEAFIRLHDDGLIYRSNRLINWSCSLQSAISDIEVESLPVEGKTKLRIPGYDKPVPFGVLTSFSYPVENSDEMLTVATTRPETMLGDVAIAIHPDDKRYLHLHGNNVIHPIDRRKLPIIVDDFVDINFGTGAVKITPGHDYTDYEVGVRHDLPTLTVIDADGKMINTTLEFNGQKRFDVRWMVVKALKEKGLFVKEEAHNMNIPLCSRSGDVVEPMLKKQWFVNCKQMAEHATQAVKNGELRIIPSNYKKVWFDWLHEACDWCISRQLWWGHRIPAYRVISPLQEEELWVSGRSESEAREKAGRKLGIPTDEVTIEQDEDVLDTWFSSALFPFAVHGWPNQTDDLYNFYPTSLLETGNDILFFWVARMVMLGQRLTGKLPFNQILLHGLLKDSVGRKMSKSLGNVVDPIDVIQGLPLQEMQTQLKQSNLDEKEIKKALESQRREFPQGLPECGADALRFTLCSYDFKAGEISMDIAHVKSYRHFCNKIWQGFRFVEDKLGTDFEPEKLENVDNRSYNAVDSWILSRLSHMIQSCDDHFRSYDLHHATRSLHTFWQSEFCDVYLETVKSVFIEGDEDDRLLKQQILFTCVETFLRALSPFMPFITEELNQRLPEKGDKSVSVCVAPYPQPHQYKWRDEDIEDEMKNVQIIINKVLSLRRFFNLTKTKADTYLRIEENELNVWNKYSSMLKTLSRAGTFHIVSDKSDIPETCCHSYINNNIHIYLNLQDIVKSTEEYHRLNQLKDKLKIDLENINQAIETDDGKSKEILKKVTQQRNDKGVELEFVNNVLKVLDNLK